MSMLPFAYLPLGGLHNLPTMLFGCQQQQMLIQDDFYKMSEAIPQHPLDHNNQILHRTVAYNYNKIVKTIAQQKK